MSKFNASISMARTSGPKSSPARIYGTGMKGYFAWMREKNPRLFAAAWPVVSVARPSKLGWTDAAAQSAQTVQASGPVPSTWADKIQSIVLGVSQAYLTAEQMKAQKKVLDLQLARAKQGLPPLDIDMAGIQASGPTATVGLSKDTQSVLLWGAAILGAVLIVPRLIK